MLRAAAMRNDPLMRLIMLEHVRKLAAGLAGRSGR